MSGNYQHNHRGGWNYPRYHGFHYANNGYPPRQAMGPAVRPAVPPDPHGQHFHYAYNGYPPRQAPRPSIPTVGPPLPHYQHFRYANNGRPPHQAPRPTIPAAIPPHQAPRPTSPAAIPSHQAPRPTSPAAIPSHQAPRPTTSAAIPPHQVPRPTNPAAIPPHQVSRPTTSAAIPPHETLEPTIPAKVSPQQTLQPTIPDVVPVQLAPKLVCKICDIVLPSGQMEVHKNGRRHRRTVQKLIENLKRLKTSNGHDAIHTTNSQMSPVVQPKKVQTLEPTIPDVVPIQLQPKLVCEICNVALPNRQMEEHKNGRRHRRRVQEQTENLNRHKTSNGHDAIPTANTQMKPVRQPKKVLKSKENIHRVKNVSFNGPFSNSKNCQMSPTVQPKKVLKSMKNGCQGENMSFKGPFFNSKFKEDPVKGSERKHMDRTVAKDWRFEVEIVSHEGPIFKNKNVPAEGSERKPIDNTGAKDHGFKRKIEEALGGGKCMKMNNGIRKPMRSSKPEVNALSISVKSPVQVPELTPSSGPAASPITAPAPVVGSTQFQASKRKEHAEIQNSTVEKNDQYQSTPMELRASVVSNISSGTEEMNCDSAAIEKPPPEGHDLPTEMSEGKDRNEIQHKPVVSNDHQQSVSVELHALAGSNINTQIKNVNSDSPTLAIEPESSTQPQVVGSRFEPQTELVLHTEMEYQVSDAIACCESQHPAKETDFQTECQVSLFMELDAPALASTNTQTEGGCYKDEAKTNVLATGLGITQLSQVSVCLKCGDEGFTEVLVYCNKCQIYALHRYCLDGPVVYTDDVTWYCEDCDETLVDRNFHPQTIFSKVVEKSSHEQCSLLQLERSDSENSAKDASQAIIEPTDCIECDTGNKQQKQCSNKSEESEEEKEFKNDCQPSSESKTASDEKCVINIDPQPIVDPIWRGNLHLDNQGYGTIAELVAHVSCLACSKVLDEARLFPHVICASLLQRSAVWPKSFVEFGADHQSIALYFFPETERVERAYDNLVDDIITKDLAIITMVENAELLIFPSTLLPIKYKRFQTKYYLWGVFKAKKTSLKTNHVAEEKTGASSTLRNIGSPGSSCASNH